MRIVFLDGFTMNPGDLSWDALAALGELELHDRTVPDLVVERLRDAEIVITNKALVPREAIESLPSLKYIGVAATGYNIVDVEAASERGIVVTNVPTYSTESVAQMVFAHILNFSQRVEDHAKSVREGDWARSADFCYWRHPLDELSGKTMGIVGYGQIGQTVARLAMAFGMRVLVSSRTRHRANAKAG